jgi:hypothetical protein
MRAECNSPLEISFANPSTARATAAIASPIDRKRQRKDSTAFSDGERVLFLVESNDDGRTTLTLSSSTNNVRSRSMRKKDAKDGRTVYTFLSRLPNFLKLPLNRSSFLELM